MQRTMTQMLKKDKRDSIGPVLDTRFCTFT